MVIERLHIATTTTAATIDVSMVMTTVAMSDVMTTHSRRTAATSGNGVHH
jgi:hypothetical protein